MPMVDQAPPQVLQVPVRQFTKCHWDYCRWLARQGDSLAPETADQCITVRNYLYTFKSTKTVPPSTVLSAAEEIAKLETMLGRQH